MKKLFFAVTLLSAGITVFAQMDTKPAAATMAKPTTPAMPTGLKVGDKAPDFVLKTADGKLFTLGEAIKSGPLVIVFYRGQWCPYCNKQLSARNTGECCKNNTKNKSWFSCIA
jgi:protein-disulfide isomerase